MTAACAADDPDESTDKPARSIDAGQAGPADAGNWFDGKDAVDISFHRCGYGVGENYHERWYGETEGGDHCYEFRVRRTTQGDPEDPKVEYSEGRKIMQAFVSEGGCHPHHMFQDMGTKLVHNSLSYGWSSDLQAMLLEGLVEDGYGNLIRASGRFEKEAPSCGKALLPIDPEDRSYGCRTSDGTHVLVQFPFETTSDDVYDRLSLVLERELRSYLVRGWGRMTPAMSLQWSRMLHHNTLFTADLTSISVRTDDTNKATQVRVAGSVAMDTTWYTGDSGWIRVDRECPL